MGLNRLKTFLKVAQYGSFKQVADENFITQRAVSKQMRQLEDELNVTLFHRGKNKVTLTPEGHRFISSAQDIVNNYTTALNDLHRSISSDQMLRVGYFSVFEKKLLQNALYSLLTVNPELSLTIREGSNEHLTESVRNGSLDLALSISYGQPAVSPQSNLTVRTIFTDEMVMGVSTLNPLSKHSVLTAQDLSTLPILYYSPETSTFLLESFMASMPFLDDYSRIHRVTSTEQMDILVALNQAFAFYPGGLINHRRTSADGQIRYLPISSVLPQSYDIVALYNQVNQNPMLEKLLGEF